MQADDPWRLLVAGDTSGFQPALQQLQQAGQAVHWQALRHLAQLDSLVRETRTDLLICLPDARLSLAALLASWQDVPHCPLLYIQPPDDPHDRTALLQSGLSDIASAGDTPLQVTLTGRLVQQHRGLEQAGRDKRLLEDSEATLHHLLATCQTPCAFLSEGLHLYANAAYHEWFGCSPGQLDTRSMLDLVDVDARDTLRQHLRAALRTPQTLCLHLRTWTGSERPTLLTLAPGTHRRQHCVLVQCWHAPGNEHHWHALQKQPGSQAHPGFLGHSAFLQAIEQAIRQAIMTQRDSLLLSAQLKDGCTTDSRERLGLLFLRHLSPEHCCGELSPFHFAALLPARQDGLTESRMRQLQQAGTDWTLCLVPVNRHARDARHLLNNAKARQTPPRLPHPSEAPSSGLSHTALLQAIDERRFTLGFQPFVPLRCSSPLVHEVTATLTLSECITLSAQQLAALASRHLLSGALDACLIDSALSVAASSPGEPPVLAFTPSLDSLDTPHFVPWLRERLNDHALHVSQLVLLLEASHLASVALPRSLLTCQEHGIAVALTQIGDTLLPLALLKRLEPVFVALDTSRSAQLAFQGPHQDNTRQLVQRLQAHALCVAATQVDNPDMLAAAWELGLEMVQGEAVHCRSQSLGRHNTEKPTIIAAPLSPAN